VSRAVKPGDPRTNVWVFCIPGPCEPDLKKAAAEARAKRIAMLRLAELRALTGYQRGACSPIGMKKVFPTVIDESAQLFESICVSGGQLGAQILIAPRDLAGLIGALSPTWPEAAGSFPAAFLRIPDMRCIPEG